MKRKTTVPALAMVAGFLLAASSAAAGNKIEGFYVGASAGAAYQNLGTDRSDGGPSNTYNETNFDGRIQGGYGKLFERYYVGGEVDFGKSFGKVTYQEDLRPSIAQSAVVEAESKYYVGGDLMLGYLVAEGTLIYGKLGIEYSPLEITATLGPAGGFGGRSSSVERDLWGYRLGAGIMTPLTNALSMRFEYRATLYDEDSITFTSPVGLAPVTEKLDLTRHQFMVGIDYRF